MKMIASSTGLLIALACAGIASGGDPAPGGSGANLSSLEFKAFDADLCGTTWLGIYSGEKNVGRLRIEAQRAPEGGGAAYRVLMEMEAGPTRRAVEALLDASFSIVAQTDRQGREGVFRTTSIKREGGAWTCRISMPGKGISHHEIVPGSVRFPGSDIVVWQDPGRAEAAFRIRPGTKVEIVSTDDGKAIGSPYVMHRIRTGDGREGWVPSGRVRAVAAELVANLRAEDPGANHGDLAAMLMLCRALSGLSPGRWSAQGLRWPSSVEPGEKTTELGGRARRAVTIEGQAPATIKHRGREVEAVLFKVETQGDARPIMIAVSKERRLLQIWSEGDQVKMVAGSEEESAAGAGASVPGKVKATPELADTVWAEYLGIVLENVKAKREFKSEDAMNEAARRHGFKDWTDFATRSARALGAKGWMESCRKANERFQADLEKVTKEMMEQAGEGAAGQGFAGDHEIHQPSVEYPNDMVIIWTGPDRRERAFLLAPKTRVKLLETLDAAKSGQNQAMYKILTEDGREGWVPERWCKPAPK